MRQRLSDERCTKGHDRAGPRRALWGGEGLDTAHEKQVPGHRRLHAACCISYACTGWLGMLRSDGVSGREGATASNHSLLPRSNGALPGTRTSYNASQGASGADGNFFHGVPDGAPWGFCRFLLGFPGRGADERGRCRARFSSLALAISTCYYVRCSGFRSCTSKPVCCSAVITCLPVYRRLTSASQ